MKSILSHTSLLIIALTLTLASCGRKDDSGLKRPASLPMTDQDSPISVFHPSLGTTPQELPVDLSKGPVSVVVISPEEIVETIISLDETSTDEAPQIVIEIIVPDMLPLEVLLPPAAIIVTSPALVDDGDMPLETPAIDVLEQGELVKEVLKIIDRPQDYNKKEILKLRSKLEQRYRILEHRLHIHQDHPAKHSQSIYLRWQAEFSELAVLLKMMEGL